jgi:hypothetical protein
MIPAYSLDLIVGTLGEAFDSRYAKAPSPLVKMVGVLFAPAGASITKSEILPRLDDFHHRSGNNIDFFCAGYGAYWPAGWVPDEEVVATTTDQYGNTTEWKYSSKYFNDLLTDVRKQAKKWRYSGEVDLLLLNAYPGFEGKARLDFSTTVALMISRLKADKAIESAPELFEDIFTYAEAPREHAPTQGFSDQKGLETGRSWLVDLAASLAGKAGALWTKGRHYAVLDLTV